MFPVCTTYRTGVYMQMHRFHISSLKDSVRPHLNCPIRDHPAVLVKAKTDFNLRGFLSVLKWYLSGCRRHGRECWSVTLRSGGEGYQRLG